MIKAQFRSVAYFICLSLGLLGGCAGAPKSAAPGATPKVFTMALDYSAFADMDPSNSATTEVFILSNVYETLLRYNPPGSKDRFSPVLATKWESSNGGKTWTFHLRQGVKFHDGTPFNAQAVKFSVERTKKQNGQVAYIWGPVKEIKAVDDATVVFELSYPAALDLIASSGFFAWIMSPSVADKDGAWFNSGHEAGTGPYTIEKFKQGEPVILSRFDGYWGGWTDGQITKMVLESVPDIPVRQQKMESHETDWANNLPYENLSQFDASKGLRVATGVSYRNLFAELNTRKPPLNDVRVRRALLYSFPYDTFIKKVFAGYAKRATGPIPEGMPGYAPDVNPYTFDLEKARALLKEAGQQAGFELNFTGNSEFTLHRAMVDLWQPELAKLNIKLNAKLLPWDAQWASTKTDPNKAQDLFGATWIPTYITPYDALFNLFHSEEQTAFNWAYYRNPQYDALIDKANEMLGSDPKNAEGMFRDAQKMLMDDAVVLMACDLGAAYVVSSDISGYTPNPAYDAIVFAYDLRR